MDEFDEEFYEKETRACNRAITDGIGYYGPAPSHAYLRLYEREDKQIRASKRPLVINKPQDNLPASAPDGYNSRLEYMLDSPYRTRRFFLTVIGFHQGTLDLMGRFEPRYTDLMSRWEVFGTQLCSIVQNFTVKGPATKDPNEGSELPIQTSAGEPCTFAAHNVPPELLKSFYSKWRLRSSTIETEIVYLYAEYHTVMSYLKLNPEPKFQQRRFLDLPPELIHHVMSYLYEKDCRQLGLSCCMLREASILHVYDDLSFGLNINAAQMAGLDEFKTDNEKVQYMGDLFDSIVAKFVQRISTITDHPSAPYRIRKLQFSNTLTLREPAIAAIGLAEDLAQRLIPIATFIHKLISRARNIEVLRVFHFPLNQAGANAILTLSFLHTVELMCDLDMATPTKFCCNSVLNATFTPSGRNTDKTWRILPTLSSIRWLTIYNIGPDDALPPAEIWRKANVFATLERLMICNLCFHEVEPFAQWIQQAALPNGPGLRLTQFKLDMHHGFNEEEIRMILTALRGAPMQDFALNGLTYAKPELFDLVSDAFPGLRSLTLYYRESDRQVEGREAHWPHASWEYAPRFANFTRLRHFGWNWRLDEFTPSPSGVLLFENNFPERWEEVAECAMEFFLDDWESIPRLFGVHCRSLESLVFLDKGLPMQRYWLHSTVGMGVQAEVWDVFSGPKGFSLLDVDPVHWTGWPKFYPSRK